MAARERRAFAFRAEHDCSVIEGTALPYGSVGSVGKFTEEFRKGSLKFADSGVFLNLHHRDDRLLCRFPDGGLELRDADTGLELRAELPDTVDGKDARELIRSGVLRGLSVEFVCKRDEWRGTHRIVHEAVLGGVAVVGRPAYQGATVQEGRELRSEQWLAEACRVKGVRRWRSL